MEEECELCGNTLDNGVCDECTYMEYENHMRELSFEEGTVEQNTSDFFSDMEKAIDSRIENEED